MGSHEGLDLHVLVLSEDLLQHLKVTCLRVPHYDEVGSQPLLNSTLTILGYSLDVGAHLCEREKKAYIFRSK